AYSSDTVEIDSTKILQRDAYRLQNRMQVDDGSSYWSPEIRVIVHVNLVRHAAVARNEPHRETRRLRRIQWRRCGARCSAGWCALAGEAQVKHPKIGYILSQGRPPPICLVRSAWRRPRKRCSTQVVAA